MPFSDSPRCANAVSYSYYWPSRYAPADDGSCSQNVAVMVLEAFGIPIVGSYPPRGHLCGLDINSMPATSVIKLSLAENLAIGKIYEIYINEYGQAYFQEVWPNAKTVNLDIRLCIPSSSIVNQVDGVIVRGYDSPPVRTFKNFYSVISPDNGVLNPQQVDYNQAYISFEYLLSEVQGTTSYCNGTAFSKEARISYKDPVLETSYMDGVDNLYELNAFESLVGYVIDFDGSSDPSVRYSFSDTTTLEIKLSAAIEGQTKSFDFCSPDGLNKTTYGFKTYDVGLFWGSDKYGEAWPLLNSVSQLVGVGHKIDLITDYRAFPEPAVSVNIFPTREVFSFSAGTNWYWELKPGGAVINLFYIIGEKDSNTYYIADCLSYSNILLWKGSERVYFFDGGSGGGSFVPNIGGGLGVALSTLIASVEIDRPSVVVQHQGGEALKYAKELHVAYQPIIVIDEPAPVAYTFGSGAKLVDHTLDLFDSDPATVEVTPTLRVGSLAWLQSQAQGNILDISLPFLSSDDCVNFANALYDVYQDGEDTYNLTCGPDSEPELGAKVEGYNGRINSITYSYQDASSYNINVNIGPPIINIGSWSNTLWQKRTEDVSREGIIVWTAGNGCDYVVRVRGMGVYSAINATLAAYAPGEKVQVTIHNNPAER